MTDAGPIATVEGRQVSAAVGDRSPWVQSVIAGAAATLLDVPSSFPAGPLVYAVGIGFTVFCVSVGADVLRDTAIVRFYRDRVVTETRPGPLGEAASVPYEDIDLVVREDEGNGPGTFELLRSGEDPVAMRNVRDPGTVERVLDGRVPSPSEREERASDDEDFDRAIEHERTLWRRWPSDRRLPDSAVVAAAGPAAALDGRVDVRSRSAGHGRGGDTVTDATVEQLARGQHRDGGNTGDPLSDGNITDPGTPGTSSSGGMVGDGGAGGGGAGGDGGM
jgi:hypothetical protein